MRLSELLAIESAEDRERTGTLRPETVYQIKPESLQFCVTTAEPWSGDRLPGNLHTSD